MVCHGEHTYLYSQILLYTLSQESKGGAKIKRLSQELQIHAKERLAVNWSYANATFFNLKLSYY